MAAYYMYSVYILNVTHDYDESCNKTISLIKYLQFRTKVFREIRQFILRKVFMIHYVIL